MHFHVIYIKNNCGIFQVPTAKKNEQIRQRLRNGRIAFYGHKN